MSTLSSAGAKCASVASLFLMKVKNTPLSIFLKKTAFLLILTTFISNYQSVAQNVVKDTVSKVVTAPTISNSTTAKKWYDKTVYNYNDVYPPSWRLL